MRVFIFSIVVVSSGWIGLFLDLLLGNPSGDGLGMLMFILAPLAMGVALTLRSKRSLWALGLKPNFRRAWAWYLFALLFDAAALAGVYALGTLDGAVRGTGAGTLAAVALAAAAALPSSLLKNLFEEAGWRGYLAPALFEKGGGILKHLVVALVWATWHLPYWLFFYKRSLFLESTPFGMGATIAMSYLSLFFLSVVYDTLRLRSGSLWPAVLIHALNNVLVAAFYRACVYKPGEHWIFSPAPIGALYLALAAGLSVFFLLRYRDRPVSGRT